MVARTLLTAEEFAALGSRPQPCERVDGVIVEYPPNGALTGMVAADLMGLLWTNAAVKAVGPLLAGVGYVVARAPDTVVAVPVTLVSYERQRTYTDRQGFVPFAADRMVEFETGYKTIETLRSRAPVYLAAGARIYWIVRPRLRQVVVFAPDVQPVVLGCGDGLDLGELVSGFRLPLAELFRED